MIFEGRYSTLFNEHYSWPPFRALPHRSASTMRDHVAWTFDPPDCLIASQFSDILHCWAILTNSANWVCQALETRKERKFSTKKYLFLGNIWVYYMRGITMWITVDLMWISCESYVNLMCGILCTQKSQRWNLVKSSVKSVRQSTRLWVFKRISENCWELVWHTGSIRFLVLATVFQLSVKMHSRRQCLSSESCLHPSKFESKAALNWLASEMQSLHSKLKHLENLENLKLISGRLRRSTKDACSSTNCNVWNWAIFESFRNLKNLLGTFRIGISDDRHSDRSGGLCCFVF